MGSRLSERTAMDLILYYGREGLIHHVYDVAQNMLQQMGEHPVFRFWSGVSLAMQGSHTEAIREYSAAEIQGRREVQIAAILAHVHALKKQRQIDQGAIDELETKLMMEERSALPGAWLQIAAFQMILGDNLKARESAQKCVTDTPDEYINALALLGWINLTSNRSAFVEKSISNFDKAADPTQGGVEGHVDALLGKVAFLDLKKNYSTALHMLNELVASIPKGTEISNVIHIERAKILIKKSHNAMKRELWDQAHESTQRILSKDPTNVQALMITNLYLCVVEERSQSVSANGVRELYKALEATEPRTHQLYAYCSRTLTRLSMSPNLLAATQMLINRACELDPKNAEYISEKGYQLCLAGEWAKALDTYRQALHVDDGCIGALHGIIRTQLMLGKLDEAEQQLEFLNQMQISERPAELSYLVAVMKWRKHRDQDASIQALDEAVEIHYKSCSGVPSYEFYESFNPQLLLAIIREYLQHCPTEPVSATDPPSSVAAKARKPLELLCKHVRGSLEAQLLLARVDFIQNDLEKSQHRINACIVADPTFAEAHLLAGQIAFYQENYIQAQQALEQASSEFEVRDWPQYNLLKARVANAMMKYEDAMKPLEHALALTKQVPHTKKYRPLNIQDHVAIYLELAQVHLRLKNLSAAEATIQEALAHYRGTPEEGRVVIAQAMLHCRKDVERGLAMLRSVTTTSPYFLKAKAHMANIYLNVRNNKRAFAKCYEELVEAFPTVGSYMFLGEAYMSIQEPEKAIEAYEKARAMDPNDAEMASRIGRAFITTHDYAKAIQYYKNAVKTEPNKLALRHDLASLYWKLGSYEEAEKELKNSLQKKEKNASGGEKLQSIMDDVKTTLLLAKVYKSAGDHRKASESLVQAKVNQQSVLKKVLGEGHEMVQAQKQIGANICAELGDYYTRQKKADDAVKHYNEALRHDETYARPMLALAKLYRDKGDLDGCEHQANALLRVDPTNEEASMMLADLMFRKNKYDDATYHFQQLLEKKPGNYEALTLFIQLLRRAGRLLEAPRFFTAAEQHSRGRPDPGLAYAKGLYHRHTNDPREALKFFHKARTPKDNPWAEKAVCHMIEIYLNPDSGNQWDDVPEGEEQPQHMEQNIGWAKQLLADVHDRDKRRLLEGYVKIAKRKKEDLDAAIQIFTDIMTGGGDQQNNAEASTDNLNPASNWSADKINVPCIVGMATAYQLLKATPKARNQLKRVSKAQYDQDEAEDFERAWLLLSDIHIEGGKYDLAQDLLRKCLNANKSCCRAWELMGVIYEKEHSYRDAADCYENAWRLVSEKDPGIGYKLAFNHLKAKRYVSAIDITQKVLVAHPNYPKIRKDILDKARASLRP
eukprot:TRINITY_DN5002_c0_g1_i1.p1 TRINITY_DN5002_c0_g1~~TRINITY_DN5002_c0_g1_i1.p1  ORF type:complete len:1347 (+),score=658.12 TRINITY_DN5002_c0_g1_i1:120-4160(+)